MIDVLKYVLDQTASVKRVKSSTKLPWVEHNDTPPEKIDEAMPGTVNGAPILHLFFNKGKFDLAEVAADNNVLHLQAFDVVRAIIGFISVFHVFHVGYAKIHCQFLAFLQYAFLGKEYNESKKGMALINFNRKFELAMEENKLSKQYKKPSGV